MGTEEVRGFWVAKYEASEGNTTSKLDRPTDEKSVTKSVPGATSWREDSSSNSSFRVVLSPK